MQPSKPIWQSKTMWVQVITAVIAVVTALAGQQFISDNPMLVSVCVFLLAVLNAALRWVTDMPLSIAGGPVEKVIALLLVAPLLVPSSALAAPDDTAILVDGAIAANYVVSIDGKGGVTFIPLARIARPGPAPTPGPGPTPVPLTDRGKAVMAAAKAVTGDADRAGTATALAEMYRQLADGVAAMNPPPTPESVFNALSAANNRLLAGVPPDNRNVLAQWTPVRGVIGTYWTALAGQQTVSYVALLRECAAGLDASVPGSKAINPDVLKMIMQIILLILQLLHP